MPAIELGRLQHQVTQLSDLFAQPADYVHAVVNLLRDHGLPAHRQGKVKGMRAILVRIQAPPPLLRLLTLEISQRAKQFPDEALVIADGLWAEQILETCQLAIALLGSVPDRASEVCERLEKWARENREQLLVPELASEGTRTLRVEDQEALFEMAERLLRTRDDRKQVFAIGVLRSLVEKRESVDFPRIYQVLEQVCLNPDRKIRPELAELLTSLAKASPKETEYFLSALRSTEASENARWVVRQAARALPTEARDRLAGAV